MGDKTYHHGDMDVREQRSTYDFFMGLTKWGSLLVAALVLFLTLEFCTDFGLAAAAIASIGLLVVGVFALRNREKPTGSH